MRAILLFATLACACTVAPGDDSQAGRSATRGTGKADLPGACEAGDCGGQSSNSDCWCDAQCVDLGDCCGNIGPVCHSEPSATCTLAGQLAVEQIEAINGWDGAAIDTALIAAGFSSEDLSIEVDRPAGVSTSAGVTYDVVAGPPAADPCRVSEVQIADSATDLSDPGTALLSRPTRSCERAASAAARGLERLNDHHGEVDAVELVSTISGREFIRVHVARPALSSYMAMTRLSSDGSCKVLGIAE